MSKFYSEHYTQNYIDGNVYAITGGGSGFGREAAIEILKMGGKVVIMGRHMERLQTTLDLAAEIGKAECIAAIAGDVSKYEDNQALVALAVEKFGKLDAFVANAGVMPNALLSEYKTCLPAWDECIDINFKGNLYGIIAALPQFQKQGWGHFLNVSSIHGAFPTRGAAVYSATKVAVRYLAHSVQVEFPGLIKATCISPTSVRTTNLKDTAYALGDVKRGNGLLGDYLDYYIDNQKKRMSGEHPEMWDNNDIAYAELGIEEMVWNFMFALNQPKGVSVSELTMHATNEGFIT